MAVAPSYYLVKGAVAANGPQGVVVGVSRKLSGGAGAHM